MSIERVHFGYWYPMTTLHLSEIYDFLKHHRTPLHLNKHKLDQLYYPLRISEVELKVDVLEHIEIQADDDIVINIFEDGLVTLSDRYKSIKKDAAELNDYLKNRLAPLLYYLFSTGAPIPKDLAGIETDFPCFIVADKLTPVQANHMLLELEAEPYFELKSDGIEIYRGGGEVYIINLTSKKHAANIGELIEMLIYFKEFKAQLHHYLNMHRAIWEEIEGIKEERFVRGRNIKLERTRLESYRKTIELIEGRINQMDLFMSTRSDISTKSGWDEHLSNILQFKYDNLEHTHDYIRSLWSMTSQYVETAIQMFSEINALSTKTSVQALTVISSIGVVNGVLNYLSLTKLPQVNNIGIYYFGLLLVGTLALNELINFIYGMLRYKVNAVDINRRITQARK